MIEAGSSLLTGLEYCWVVCVVTGADKYYVAYSVCHLNCGLASSIEPREYTV